MRDNLLKMYTYEDSWYDEVGNALSKYRIQKYKYVNNFLNVIIASICVFVLQIKLWMFPIAFVLADILLTGLNILTVRYIPRWYVSAETEKDLNKMISFINKKIDKIDKLYDKGSKFYGNRVILQEKYWLEDKLRTNECKLKKLQEKKVEPTPVSTVYDKINQSNKDIISEVITNISSIKLSEDLQSRGITLQFVKTKAKDIEKLLEEKPQFIDVACTTFRIYGKDLLNVINSVMYMDEDERIGYYSQLEELISEYELHLDRLKERIRKEQMTKTNIDIRVLLNEIKKDKED